MISYYTIIVVTFLQYSLSQNEGIPLTDYKELDIGCLNLNTLEPHYVFNSERELMNGLANHTSPHPACGSILMPEIDFSKRTLIGIKVSSGSCKKPVYHVDLRSDKDVIICRILFEPYNLCRISRQKAFWFSIPKTDPKNLKFEIKPYEN